MLYICVCDDDQINKLFTAPYKRIDVKDTNALEEGDTTNSNNIRTVILSNREQVNRISFSDPQKYANACLVLTRSNVELLPFLMNKFKDGGYDIPNLFINPNFTRQVINYSAVPVTAEESQIALSSEGLMYNPLNVNIERKNEKYVLSSDYNTLINASNFVNNTPKLSRLLDNYNKSINVRNVVVIWPGDTNHEATKALLSRALSSLANITVVSSINAYINAEPSVVHFYDVNTDIATYMSVLASNTEVFNPQFYVYFYDNIPIDKKLFEKRQKEIATRLLTNKMLFYNQEED